MYTVCVCFLLSLQGSCDGGSDEAMPLCFSLLVPKHMQIKSEQRPRRDYIYLYIIYIILQNNALMCFILT